MSSGHLTPTQVALLAELDDTELRDLAETSDYEEQVTPADRAHLAGCARCATMQRDLERVRRTLGAATVAAEPLPAEVAGRVTARLAAEARLMSNVRQLDARQRATRRRGWLVQAAAGVSVLALAGALGIGALRGSSGSSYDSAPSSVVAGANGGASVTSGAAAGAAARLSETRSGSAYTSTSLAGVVSALLSAPTAMADRQAAPLAVPQPESATTAEARASATTQLPADCLAALAAGRGRTPVLVDSGTWQGRPARLVVLRLAEDPQRGDAYVVEPTCRGGNAGTLFYAGVRLP